MERRRVLMGMQGELPGAYRRLEYIEGNGTQYIHTQLPISVVSSFNTSWELVFAITSFSKTQIIAGNDYDFKQIPILSSKRVRKDWAGNFALFSQIMTEYTVYSLKQDKNIYVFYNVSEMITEASNEDGHFALFAKLMRGSTAPEQSTIALMRLYGFTAKTDSGYISKMIPCVRKSDNKPGMYDTVSKTFYTNAGTGEFIVPA